jgi:hypothetical protein
MDAFTGGGRLGDGAPARGHDQRNDPRQKGGRDHADDTRRSDCPHSPLPATHSVESHNRVAKA